MEIKFGHAVFEISPCGARPMCCRKLMDVKTTYQQIFAGRCESRWKATPHICDQKYANLLTRSKTWYVDGTFKVVKAPFTQLFTIHAFVQSGECIKQIPVAFILMSGERKRDYRKVLKVIKNLTKDRKLEKFVLDFESALWRAIPHIFPGALIQGCSFHWAQCIWRKIQNIGLAPAYKHDNATHKLCRQSLALPYLPKEHIPAIFENLATKGTTSMLTELVTYIRVNWIEDNYLVK